MFYTGAVRAEYRLEPCRTALNRVRGMPFRWSLNPYMGCVHRCTFCYVRHFEHRADRPADDRYGASIRYSHEPRALETAGGVAQALPLLGLAPFAVVSGDIHTEFDYALLAPRIAGPHSWACSASGDRGAPRNTTPHTLEKHANASAPDRIRE